MSDESKRRLKKRKEAEKRKRKVINKEKERLVLLSRGFHAYIDPLDIIDPNNLFKLKSR